MTDIDVRPETVLNWLREQQGLHQRLEALSIRQRGMVVADDPKPLLRLLAERQSLTTEMARLARQIAPVRRQWTAYQRRLSPAQALEAGRLVDASAALLSGVMTRDEEDARRLAARKRVVSKQAGESAASKAMLNGYVAATSGGSLVGSWQG